MLYLVLAYFACSHSQTAAEKFLLAMVSRSPAAAGPVVARMLASLDAATPPVHADAVLSAVGCCAYYLRDHTPFATAVFPRVVALLGAHSTAAVLQRRAAALCGQWIPSGVQPADRIVVYQ